MNPKGAAPSDVWRDLPRRKLRDSVIPADVLARVAAMSFGDGRKGLHVIQTGGPGTACRTPVGTERVGSARRPPKRFRASRDCVSFLNRVERTRRLFDPRLPIHPTIWRRIMVVTTSGRTRITASNEYRGMARVEAGRFAAVSICQGRCTTTFERASWSFVTDC
jgi:hypothetical protein